MWTARTRPVEVRHISGPSDLAPLFTTPVPSHKIREADGTLWEIADIPGRTLHSLELANAEWAGADLHGATFVDCDMRGLDLRGANLCDVTFKACQLEGARLELAETGNTVFTGCGLRGMMADDCLGEVDLTGASAGVAATIVKIVASRHSVTVFYDGRWQR